MSHIRKKEYDIQGNKLYFFMNGIIVQPYEIRADIVFSGQGMDSYRAQKPIVRNTENGVYIDNTNPGRKWNPSTGKYDNGAVGQILFIKKYDIARYSKICTRYYSVQKDSYAPKDSRIDLMSFVNREALVNNYPDGISGGVTRDYNLDKSKINSNMQIMLDAYATIGSNNSGSFIRVVVKDMWLE